MHLFQIFPLALISLLVNTVTGNFKTSFLLCVASTSIISLIGTTFDIVQVEYSTQPWVYANLVLITVFFDICKGIVFSGDRKGKKLGFTSKHHIFKNLSVVTLIWVVAHVITIFTNVIMVHYLTNQSVWKFNLGIGLMALGEVILVACVNGGVMWYEKKNEEKRVRLYPM